MGIREEKSSGMGIRTGIRISRMVIRQVPPCDLFNGCAQWQSYAGLRFRRLGAWVPEGSIDPAWKWKDEQGSLHALLLVMIVGICGGLISRKVFRIYLRSTEVTDINRYLALEGW